jgi:hypothetical protein
VKLTILSILFFTLTVQTFSQQNRIEENRLLKVKNGKYGLTDTLNKIIVPSDYDFIEYKNNRLIVSKKSLQGLLTTDNDLIIPIKYQFILPRSNKRFILWTPRSVFGLSDADGKTILPVQYKSVSSTENDDFYITKNDKNLNGVYNFNGEKVLPEIYRFYTIDGYRIFAIDDTQPLILNIQNPEETILLDKDISFVETARHHSMREEFYQIVKKENKFGVINARNQVIVPIAYDEVKSSQHWRYFIITNKGKVGLINVDGNIVKEPIYDAIELRKEYILLRRKNQKDEIYSYKW